MKKITALAAGVMAIALGTTSGFAGGKAMSPVGVWQSADGESRFSVSFCGDGLELCAKLTWLHPRVSTEENLSYVNKLVVSHATPTGANTWSGSVDLFGEVANGKIRQAGNNKLVMTGCQLVLCQTVTFVRIS